MTTEIVFGKDRYSQSKDMIDWCVEQFGEGHHYRPSDYRYRWTIHQAFGNTHFYFLEESDAVLFSLRWA